MHGTALLVVVLRHLLMSCTTLLVGFRLHLTLGTILLAVVLDPLLMCLLVGCDPFRPALLVSHACNMLPASSQALVVRCPALLALLALLQISSIALLVSLDPLLMHGTALLVVVLRHLLMSCTTLLPLFALVQISSIALLMVLHVLLLYALHMCCPALLVLPALFQPGKVESNFPRPLNVSPTPPIHHQLLAIFDVVLHPLLTHGTSQLVQDKSAMSHHAGATLSVTHTPDYCQLFPGPVRGRFHK